MKTKMNKVLLNAAVAGMIGAMVAPVLAHAEGAAEEKGHCIGANACGGKSGCAVAGDHSCKGQNKCKGTGFTEMTKAECEKLMKKNKSIKFEVAKK